MKERFSLKDHLFNKTKVQKIAREIKNVYLEFEDKNFISKVVKQFPELELKERIAWIRQCLREFLPQDYRQAVKILLKALPPELDPKKTDNDFGEFIYAPYNDFVAFYGREKIHLKFSLAALKEMTKRFSAEDAIRYFINDYPKETLAELQKWSKDKNYHVRRLCSEGTRPKLPWSPKIILTPGEALPVLANLFSDKTRYVTRSVANHLNDIAKTNPDLVIRTLVRWEKSKQQNLTEMDFITRHALRTLIKQGNKQALTLLGYDNAPKIIVKNFSLVSEEVAIGSAAEFSFLVLAEEDVNLLIDYTLFFQDKKGGTNNKKIHKLKQLVLQKGESISIKKKHPLRANMTTRQLYRGQHQIELQINGRSFGKVSFELV